MIDCAMEDLIAHRQPMILISRLVKREGLKAVCEVDINESSLFYQQDIDGVATYIGIEYMAQSIAAYAGDKALAQGKGIDIGFLLGSRKYQTFTSIFKSNTTYQITVEELYQEENGLSVFMCEIYLGNDLIAQAKINTFQPEDPEEFLREQ